jgi:hypothetical protein
MTCHRMLAVLLLLSCPLFAQAINKPEPVREVVNTCRAIELSQGNEPVALTVRASLHSSLHGAHLISTGCPHITFNSDKTSDAKLGDVFDSLLSLYPHFELELVVRGLLEAKRDFRINDNQGHPIGNGFGNLGLAPAKITVQEILEIKAVVRERDLETGAVRSQPIQEIVSVCRAIELSQSDEPIVLTVRGSYHSSIHTANLGGASCLFPTPAHINVNLDKARRAEVEPMFDALNALYERFAIELVVKGPVEVKKGFRLQEINGYSLGNGFGDFGLAPAKIATQEILEIKAVARKTPLAVIN